MTFFERRNAPKAGRFSREKDTRGDTSTPEPKRGEARGKDSLTRESGNNGDAGRRGSAVRRPRLKSGAYSRTGRAAQCPDGA
jgi:hypothetical protein